MSGKCLKLQLCSKVTANNNVIYTYILCPTTNVWPFLWVISDNSNWFENILYKYHKSDVKKSTKPSAGFFFPVCWKQLVCSPIFMYCNYLSPSNHFFACMYINGTFVSCFTFINLSKKFLQIQYKGLQTVFRVWQHRIYSFSHPKQFCVQIVPPPACSAIGYIAFLIPS